ncbi:MAG: sodium/solute symporter [bacterium]
MIISGLTWIDYLTMAVYTVATLWLGLYMGRNIYTVKDYFLSNRRLPWWAVGMSMVVTDIGAVDIIGIAGSAYLYGIVLGNYDWLGSVPVMVICGFVFIPYFWRSEVYTIPEFLGRRFNDGVRTVTALVWGIFLAANLGITLYATAVMLKAMLGWSEMFSIVVSAMIVGVYTLAGGLTAVVYTDALQCVVMIGGCSLVLVIGLIRVGGFHALADQIYQLGPEFQNHFSLVLPVDTPTPHPWSGILLGLGMVLAPAYWFGNQSILQRCFGARSEFEAKASFMWGAFLKTLIPFIMVVPGLIALAHNPAHLTEDQADSVLPALIRDILPPGLLGVFFAAFLAALMSNFSSCLNSAATLWTKDIYERFILSGRSERHYLIVGRVATVLCTIFGAWYAIWIFGKSASIYNVIQTMLSLFQGPSLVLILTGVLWWRTTGVGAFVGLVAGLCCSTGLFLVNVYASEPLFKIQEPFLYIALWSFLFSLGVTVVVSLLTPPEPEEKLAGLVYGYKRRNPNANAG